MTKKKKLIPFGLLPAAWGLRGKSYAIAEAEYHWHGEELDRRLAEIDADTDADKLAEQMLVLDVKYKKKTEFAADCIRAKIDLEQDERSKEDEIKLVELKIKHHIGEPYTCHKKLAELKNDNEEDSKLALLKVELAYEKIDQHEYDKQCATVRNEPWIGIVDNGYNPGEGVNGLYIEFDWNDAWILYLRAHGYTGTDEDAIVERWFQDLNRSLAEPEDGYNFIQTAPRNTRFDRGDGSADYV